MLASSRTLKSLKSCPKTCQLTKNRTASTQAAHEASMRYPSHLAAIRTKTECRSKSRNDMVRARFIFSYQISSEMTARLRHRLSHKPTTFSFQTRTVRVFRDKLAYRNKKCLLKKCLFSNQKLKHKFRSQAKK